MRVHFVKKSKKKNPKKQKNTVCQTLMKLFISHLDIRRQDSRKLFGKTSISMTDKVALKMTIGLLISRV